MSEKITLEQFEKEMKPVLVEVGAVSARLNELRNMFTKLANKVELKSDEDSDEYEDELEEFRDAMFEAARNFIDNIDYEYSEVNPGSVEIWEQSTC